MGFPPSSILCHRIRHLVTFLLCLLIAWNHLKLNAEGRRTVPSPRLKNEGIEVEPNQTKGEEKLVMGRLLIGSRPPRCERRCRSCGHCEAVQVPIAPAAKSQPSRTSSSRAFLPITTPNVADSRADDISNYKPMCWKCKCGNFMFNP